MPSHGNRSLARFSLGLVIAAACISVGADDRWRDLWPWLIVQLVLLVIGLWLLAPWLIGRRSNPSR